MNLFRSLPFATRALLSALLAVWLGANCGLLWLTGEDQLKPVWLVLLALSSAGLTGWMIRRARSPSSETVDRYLTASLACFLFWPVAVAFFDVLGLDGLRATSAEAGLWGVFSIGLMWVIWGVEKAARHYAQLHALGQIPPSQYDADQWRRSSRDRARAWIITTLAVPLIVASVIEPLWAELFPAEARRIEAGVGSWTVWARIGMFTVPLAALVAGWLVWFVRHPGLRNPFDLEAWYYGRGARKLNQSVLALLSYSLMFLLMVMLFGQIGGCKEIYEMPAGGGEQKTMAQQVQIQKVIKKKFVINPYSLIIFNPPPIDEIKLQLTEVTAHQYKVGYGTGAGAGFAGGTSRGKVRFIRLEYSGGDWNHNFGVGADLNMLVEYNTRTQQPVANKTESRTVGQLSSFPVGKSPPMVFMSGQGNISLSKNEVKVLREYLLDKHGMLFAENGGSMHYHNQFFAMMGQVLPNVAPVKIPLDDTIHRIPYQIPFLPYVAPHGGKDAWGWKVDGRWVAYYHPGEISDAWTDDHSGVSKEVYEYCYQLGTNIIFYGHAEYAKWLEARQKK